MGAITSFGRDMFVPEEFNERYSIRSLTPLSKDSNSKELLLPSINEKLPHIVLKKFNFYGDLDKARRCLTELAILPQLQHENILRFRSAYSTDGDEESLSCVYIITEFPGTSLRDVIDQKVPLTFDDTRRIISDALRALRYLESVTQVPYCGLTPDRMWCDENGRLKISGVRQRESENASKGKKNSDVYKPLEQLVPWSEPLTSKVDVFTLGLILSEMLTGEALFAKRKDGSVIQSAIDKCGPIEESALEKIKDADVRNTLSSLSRKAQRIDFIQYLTENARKGVMKDILERGDDLRDFIDRTLRFDPCNRMSVEEALRSRLIDGMNEAPMEDFKGMPETLVPIPLLREENDDINACKRRILRQIQESPTFP
ncbi:hypothetical protein PFISCL1PPCAC_25418 [Pristionchus fissidentatus]|uniref:Protein kinase domain-containing protein n=1 Tax=Pristionchus fissidentatus TaxID=1538716 RepID=A0AAV5WQ53_9BILA|nr:hypothetical protein PFISCL1PPCAC_25418 [Pristionchus fissidentatus]